MTGFGLQLVTLAVPTTILTLVAFLMVLLPADFGIDTTLAQVYQAFALLAVGFLTTALSLIAMLGQGPAMIGNLKPLEKVYDCVIYLFMGGVISIFVALGVYVGKFYAAYLWVTVLLVALLWLGFMLYAVIQVARSWNDTSS